MKHAKQVFFVLMVLVLAACNNGINAQSAGDQTQKLLGVDSDGDGLIAEEDYIRAHFVDVVSASVDRRPHFDVLPMSANLMACRIDDPNNCEPPVFRESVKVRISGTGSAGSANLERPEYLQSLSVEFDIEVSGSRRCLDQAIDALTKKASLSIAGRGTFLAAIAQSGGGTIGGTVEGSSGSGTVEGSGNTTIIDDGGGDLPNPPIWPSYTHVIYEQLDSCEAVERFEDPKPVDREPQTTASSAD